MLAGCDIFSVFNVHNQHMALLENEEEQKTYMDTNC